MGFLKKSRAPDELPDLAIDSSKESSVPKKNIVGSIGPPANYSEVIRSVPLPTDSQASADSPQPSTKQPQSQPQVHGEHYLEFSEKDYSKTVTQPVTPVENKMQTIPQKIPAQAAEIQEQEDSDDNSIANEIPKEVSGPRFFDKILSDINGEIQDVSNIEDWYENKFESEDIISNMKGYWEKNKADIIIQSFGAEYKKKINEKIKELQKLEEDWRGIYFDLIKKEEEMKKVEQDLKASLSEFVDLHKRKKGPQDAKD